MGEFIEFFLRNKFRLVSLLSSFALGLGLGVTSPLCWYFLAISILAHILYMWLLYKSYE